MKVSHVNFSDRSGGAGIAAYRLHLGLIQMKVESNLFVRKKTTNDPNVISTSKILEFRNKANSALEIMLQKILKIENHSLPIGFLLDRNYVALNKLCPDVVNIHWINGGFFNMGNISKINAKIVWTLHDMWLFNSLSHYSDSYLTKEQKVIDRLIINYKKIVLDRIKNMVIITPSKWLAECANNSTILYNKDIRVINNGIDIELFRPRDKFIARTKFGISPGKKIILFGSFNAENSKRKGIDLLKKTLLSLHESGEVDNDVEVVVFGGNEVRQNNDFGFTTKYIGRINDEEELANLYSSADLFALPSRLDNLPNTAIEALACGTPVLAFKVGGLEEIVDHKINGYLASPFSTFDLRQGLRYLLYNSEYPSIKENCRTKVIQKFDVRKMAAEYLDVYNELLSNNKSV